MAEGRWVRVFHEDMKRNYKAVWADDRLLATWLRLLAAHDLSWPAPAELPAKVNRAALKRLADLGIVILLPDQEFEVRGLNADRTRRNAAGRAGAYAKWRANADANADAERMRTRPDQTRPIPDNGLTTYRAPEKRPLSPAEILRRVAQESLKVEQ